MIFFAEREKFRGKASTFFADIPQSEGKRNQSEKTVVCAWFRPPLTPPNLGGEEISTSISFLLLS